VIECIGLSPLAAKFKEPASLGAADPINLLLCDL